MDEKEILRRFNIVKCISRFLGKINPQIIVLFFDGLNWVNARTKLLKFNQISEEMYLPLIPEIDLGAKPCQHVAAKGCKEFPDATHMVIGLCGYHFIQDMSDETVTYQISFAEALKASSQACPAKVAMHSKFKVISECAKCSPFLKQCMDEKCGSGTDDGAHAHIAQVMKAVSDA